MQPSLTAETRRRLLVVATLTLATVGCGPMYQTEYSFTPPTSERGEFCIMQCSNNQEHCRQMEEMKKDNCENRSQFEQERCRNDIWRDKHRDPKWYECGSSSCSVDYERCEQNYRNCYQSCGGKVTAETRCVANCDQIPPTPSGGK